MTPVAIKINSSLYEVHQAIQVGRKVVPAGEGSAYINKAGQKPFKVEWPMRFFGGTSVFVCVKNE